MGFFSVLFGVLVLINRLFPRFTLLGYWVGANPGTATLLVFLSFTLSVLFVCLGIIGEYLVLLLQEIKKRPAAIVASVIGEVRPYDSAYALLDVSATAVTVERHRALIAAHARRFPGRLYSFHQSDSAHKRNPACMLAR